jgi:hypothetical protein
LDTFFRSHLADRGRVVLGEPGRRNCDEFQDWLSGRGWAVQPTAVAIGSQPGRIFEAELDTGRG